MSGVFSEEVVNWVGKEMKVGELGNGTIGDVLVVGWGVEEVRGIGFMGMEEGCGGVGGNKIGIEGEKKGVDRGVGWEYGGGGGVGEVKEGG